MPPRARLVSLIVLLLSVAPAVAQTPAGPNGNSPPRRDELQPRRDEQPANQASHLEPVRLSQQSAEKALPLPPAKSTPRDGQTSASPVMSLATLVGSLACVLGLFLLLSWCFRKSLPKGSVTLPSEAVEVLGQTRLIGRHQVHLVRCGNKLLLVSATATGADTLTEITDPVEIDRLAGLCRQAQASSATAAFRKIFDSFATSKGVEDGDA